VKIFFLCVISEITSREFLAALPAKRLTPQKLRCLNDLARGLLMQIPGLIINEFFYEKTFFFFNDFRKSSNNS